MTQPPRPPDGTPDPAAIADARPGFGARLRTWLFAGILVTAPIAISIYVTWVVVHFIDTIVIPWIPPRYLPDTYLPFAIPGLGVLVVLVILTTIGALTASLLGRYFVHLSDRLLGRMPMVRSVYGATKQIVETVFSSKGNAFRSVVLVEFPRQGMWSIGFVTGVTTGEVQHVTRENVVNVFVPTTPNPTSGYLVFVPKEDVVELQMSVEEAIKMIISGGIVTPPDRRPVEEQGEPIVSARHVY